MSIILHDLGFSYGDGPVFSHADLTVNPGEMLSILGPNGAGKTTLLNAVVGLTKPSEGEIYYEGLSHRKIKLTALAQLVGYVPQVITPTFDYSVLDYVITGCAPHLGTFERPHQEQFNAAMAAIQQMGIEHLAEKSYKQISGGERQQVSIARVLAQNPKYIFMDEPTAHLDFGNQIHVLKIIKQLSEQGYGVVFTTHNPDQVLLLGGRVAVLDRQGRLHHGSCDEMIESGLLTELFGTELCLADLGEGGRKVCFSPRL